MFLLDLLSIHPFQQKLKSLLQVLKLNPLVRFQDSKVQLFEDNVKLLVVASHATTIELIKPRQLLLKGSQQAVTVSNLAVKLAALLVPKTKAFANHLLMFPVTSVALPVAILKIILV